VKLQRVTTAREMLAACEAALPADVLVMAAAVADWRPDFAANSKIKKTTANSSEGRVVPLIKLVENPDILATLVCPCGAPANWSWALPPKPTMWWLNAVAKRTPQGRGLDYRQ
jgi:phosphopantothenoylcysteine decarboxylase/phosphopantothenate--cysteine ligase